MSDVSGGSSGSVADLVRERLADSDISAGARRLALAAVLGSAVLEHALASPDEPIGAKAAVATDGVGGHVWLRSVTLRGFRGVGPSATLNLEPGPGLTLIVGRNGSGKSSLAEGIEAALTGHTKRLDAQPAAWRRQWRNIHDDAQAEVTVEFQVDGDERPLTVRRRWMGKDLGEAMCLARLGDEPPCDLDELGWSEALEQYRPFLSYDDLGAVSDKPSVVFDLLFGVLGLDAITEAQNSLTEKRTELGKIVSAPREALPDLLAELELIDDDRARLISSALASEPPKIATVREALIEGPSFATGDSIRADLHRLASLAIPEAQTVKARVEKLREAANDVEAVKGTDADEAARLADLLGAAVAHHAAHGDEACPVCGQGLLDSSWHERTSHEVAALRRRASDAIKAAAELSDSLTRAQGLLNPMPAELTGTNTHGIDTSGAQLAWQAWIGLADETDAMRLADGLTHLLDGLVQSLSQVRQAAADGLRRLEDVWRPVAGRVQGWLDQQARAEAARTAYDNVSSALSWIKNESERLRDERLAPFRTQSAEVWADLRQESNVELGPIAFAGAGRTRRKLDVPVQIDGVAGAVAMLGNGELHALGLSLFLPRSTAPDSPFRYVVIDDPVQAMDPTKVEGLAKVLHRTAADRQVVVFTHDDRLADAIRRLMLPTTILEVLRREGSRIELVSSLDPVSRYLSDARQIARTDRLPDDLAAVAVAGSCRDAVEAACQRLARRRLLAAGIPIGEVDERLRRAQTTNHRVALALLGDSRRTGQVMSTLNKLAGGSPWAADVLRSVREGTHKARTELELMVKDSERLCDLILKVPVP